MSEIPPLVRQRLRELLEDATSLQAANFASADLVYHELQHEQHEPLTGAWSMDDAVFSFSLIGQVSAHHTFLGEYGDLLAFTTPERVTFNSISRAKWTITLVLPNATDGSPEGAALQRQADALQHIEDECCVASPMPAGTIKSASFVYRARDATRASVYSENIYRHALVLRNEEVEASKWPDSRHIFRQLVDDRKATLAVRPLELYTTSGDPIDMLNAAASLSPGTWVELHCTLRMWDNSTVPMRRKRTGDHERRAKVRSFQVGFDSAQVLSPGRLIERPRTTAPTRPAAKRPFGALVLHDAAPRPLKRAKAVSLEGASTIAGAGPM